MRIRYRSSEVCSSYLNDRIEGDAEITRLQEESLDPYVETRTLCLEKRQREIDALKGRSNDVAAIPATETVRETGTSVNSEASVGEEIRASPPTSAGDPIPTGEHPCYRSRYDVRAVSGRHAMVRSFCLAMGGHWGGGEEERCGGQEGVR